MARGRLRGLCALGLLMLPACGPPPHAPSTKAAPATVVSIDPAFDDVTAASGLRFRHHTGAQGRFFMPETMGAGCAFFDYDADGQPDILLLNGADWSPSHDVRHTPALYRNDHGRFVDVTRQAGLDFELFAMGCASADYDNDGYPDLCVTGVGGCRVLRNEPVPAGGRRFRDVTARLGMRANGWCTGATWFDYDRDGRLDLFVARYVQWTPQTDRPCTLTGSLRSYCTPQDYDGESSLLYHNRADGRFEDVSATAGIAPHVGKSLGVLALDENGDGWPDLFVANDTERNFLFRNQGNGHFEEIGLQEGVALGETGRARAGMGVDGADLDGSGRETLVVTNFAGEGVALFGPMSRAGYTDVAGESGLRAPTVPYVGFGACFLDADLDGAPDLLIANGHIYDDRAAAQIQQPHAQPVQLFLNRSGRFMQAADAVAGGRSTPASGAIRGGFGPMVARGAAVADFDLDGRPDILLSANGGEPRLLRNVTPGRHTWLRLTLQGRRSNRSAVGARVTVRAAGRSQTRRVRAGGSYCSQSELPLTFSLLGADRAEEVRVLWPSGKEDRWTALPAMSAQTLVER